MICLGRTGLRKSRKDLSLRVETIGPRCQCPYRNSMRVDLWFLVSGGERSVADAKAQVMRLDNSINASPAREQVK